MILTTRPPALLLAAALFAALVAITVAACSGDSNGGRSDVGMGDRPLISGDGTQSPQPVITPSTGIVCSLLTEHEVTEFAGEPMGNASALELGEPLGQQVCTYGALTDGSNALVQVSVVRQEDLSEALIEDGFTLRQLYDETLALYPKPVLVPGISDAAFRHDDTLEVLHGDVAFSVSLARQDGNGRRPARIETLVQMAYRVMERLDAAR